MRKERQSSKRIFSIRLPSDIYKYLQQTGSLTKTGKVSVHTPCPLSQRISNLIRAGMGTEPDIKTELISLLNRRQAQRDALEAEIEELANTYAQVKGTDKRSVRIWIQANRKAREIQATMSPEYVNN